MQSTNDLQALARRLKQVRLQKGFHKIDAFATSNSFGTSQYKRYEKGASMRYDTLIRILRALDISITDFFSEGFD